MLYYLVIALVVVLQIILEVFRETIDKSKYFPRIALRILTFVGYFYLIYFIGSVWKVMLIMVGIIIVSAIIFAVFFKGLETAEESKS